MKIPPHSIEAERGVLGSILLDKEGIFSVSAILTEADFYDPNNGLIYGAMMDLFTRNKPIDILTVREHLDDRQNLEKIGGNAYLIELTESIFTSANIYQYAQIVKQKGILRKLIKAGNDILLAGYDEESDINKLLEKAEQSLFTVTQTFIQNKLVHIRDIINLRYEEFAEIHENPEHANDGLVHTGFKSLDGKIGGFKPGDMIILAARPSMGKTALALNVAQHIGEAGKNVAVFSLEMSKEQLTDRLICATMGVDSWKLNKGLLEDDEFMRMGDALERLSKANIYIDDSAAGNLLEIKSKARRLKIESGLDFIVIDYLQLMSAGNPMNRVQEISDISRGIKSLARELGVPIMALSQLSRAVESRVSKEPILSDLRESGSIEQDADVVLMIYREDYYDEFTENKGITNVFVRKNRNGPVGGADLKFEKKYMKFYDVERSREGGYED
ncbi:replicative DNA helicase [Candidatus Gracilibacteria bacterium]|nr:replicative DNA helicase [Candidatus Gracilibacteria bacterium]OIO76509.1 MAG: replicative DNA helicase [Candidatus Gracilibacteria bacterium CG1_02_38_174]PIQ12385.1 MAG: replicative DNA helicase [Candidatus Gracilibacteria bacterium CG18_big_fil_WC_8_21_14_2_50_38_16]PIQ41659.1 MAG: replicative DNA helicase [Candidatus Gracilibacteria bacterium CG12_big_fil_rev_8_21_14_0_65_38_15]PIZ01318.1 MAG: replicative DNA helicase [Candidatus Gracilibacteria bacterium CG_4_10_14_0_8_um_filter_38_28]